MVETICRTCGLPKALCVCEEREREGQTLRVRVETRRYGKAVTVVDGFADDEVADATAKLLKTSLAAGGTSKGGRVEIQGDHRRRAREVLEKQGFRVDAS